MSSAPAGITASQCDGSPASNWTLSPCSAKGCVTGSNQSWLQSALDRRVIGIPGAVGPWVDLWPVDDPTGALHNELWAWSPTDATMRCLNTGVPDIFMQCLTIVSPPPPPPPCTQHPRVACHIGTWDTPPASTPSGGVVDGPLLGNGDVGAVLAAPGGTAIEWYFGKSDMWGTNTVVDQPIPSLHSDTFYTAISAGLLSIQLQDATSYNSVNFSASQNLAHATVDATSVFGASKGSVPSGVQGWTMTDSIIAIEDNAMLANFLFNASDAEPRNWTFTLTVQTDYPLPLVSGVADGTFSVPWVAKHGVSATQNSMILMPCDTRTFVTWPSITTFSVDATGRVFLLNSSQTVPLCPIRASLTKLSLGPCNNLAADWRLVPAPAAAPLGTHQLQSAADPSSCAWPQGPEFHNSGGFVVVGLCSAQTSGWWTWDAAQSQLKYNDTQCLTAVPPNVNITLGMALTLVTADGTAVSGTIAVTHDPSGSWASSTLTAALKPNTSYTVVVVAITTRDIDWRADPVAAAVALARTFSGAGGPALVRARRSSHAQFWQDFWAVSEVSLGADRQLLEGFYFGAQYLLACTTRAGKVAPGLWGVWAVSDRNGWNGDHTLDYNAQANYYGSCSSNRCEQMKPYLDQISSEWFVEVSRLRAGANWLAKGSAGGPGQTSQSMCCGPMVSAWEDPAICPPTAAGGYSGIEMTSHMGPFPGLYYFSDLSLRMVAAMSVKPFIDYVDYTGDHAFLNTTAFNLVDQVGDFILSYVTLSNTTNIYNVLNSCAQEICSGGLAVENNPHHDIAYFTTILRTLIRWANILSRETEKIAIWTKVLNSLAAYPVDVHSNLLFRPEAVLTSVNAGDLESMSTVWVEADGAGSVFPSQASGYSIVYTAALHPAESVSQSDIPSLLSTARNTVRVLSAINGWRPLNGLCMGWCPAPRCIGSDGASEVLDGWESALANTMFNNFYPNLGGGGIEQAGASEAVNSALVQSQEGFVRFFPMWPPSENASFTNLRVRGSFLVSAVWQGLNVNGSGGTVAAPIVVVPDVAANYPRDFFFLTPWVPETPPTVVLPSGKLVPVSQSHLFPQLPVFLFTAVPGEIYHIQPSSN